MYVLLYTLRAEIKLHLYRRLVIGDKITMVKIVGEMNNGEGNLCVSAL